MVNGTIDPGFEAVRAEFERCFTERGETGASFSAFAGGRALALDAALREALRRR